MNILVVDDEKEIVDLISLYLSNEGYNVYRFYDSEKVVDFLKNQKIDLAILDVMMPGKDGFDLCCEIRENFQFPVLFVTAKVEQLDKIKGFNIGADDYITKPFVPAELIARVKSNLRRYKQYNNQTPDIIDFRELVLDSNKHTVFLNDKEVKLTPKEFEILYYLCASRGKVVKIEELYEKVWNDKFMPSSGNTIMVHIRHIREKMNDAIENPKYIKTIWGIGYEVEE